jgi:cyclopropane fatty-acyl-phospholipid synthase-like methyltransferase
MKILNYIKNEFPNITNKNFKKFLTQEWVDENFMFVIQASDYQTLQEFCEAMHVKYISRYFSGVWKSKHGYPESGRFLIKFANMNKPKSVLDVGCGDNYYKDKIQNLVGLDPYHPKADIKKTLEEFEPKKQYDQVLALGSLNFGTDKKHIEEMFDKVVNMTKVDGYLYFRFNPGIDHKPFTKDKSSFKFIDWFPWTQEHIFGLMKLHNLKMIRFAIEKNQQGDERYFYIMQRLA